jgi:hypothetical protein
MKLLLEEQKIELVDGEKQISFNKVKELKDVREAKKAVGKKRFVHYCYHDEKLADGKSHKPCRRVEV